MRKVILLALLSMIITGCTDPDVFETNHVNCIEVNNTNDRTNEFLALIEEYSRKGLPGIKLLVEDSSGIFVGAAGFADVKEGVVMQTCHISKSASITKMVLAIITFKLYEEGILNIDLPITAYIDEVELKGIANATEVTVRDLIDHSTGIYDVITGSDFYLQVLNNPTHKWESEELLEFARDKDPDFVPNTSSGYSNTNYLLLNMVIQRAQDMPVHRLFRTLIFDPVDMDRSYIHWQEPLPQNQVAQGYFDLYQNGKLVNLSNWNTGSGNGYGGMYSTVHDLHKLMKALFVDSVLLSPNSLSQMATFNEEVMETRKYLGAGIFKDFIDLKENYFAYGHRGRDLAWSADLFYFPQKNAILAMEVTYGTDSDSDLKEVFLELRDKVGMLILD